MPETIPTVLDPQTLQLQWQSHVDRLLIVARGVGEPAEDAVQEAFLQLAKQRALPDDPFAWLVRVTRNQILQWRRSGSRRLAREQRSAPWLEAATEDRLDDSLDAAMVTGELHQLAGEVREIIVMHLWGQLTFEQIADVVGSSRSSVHRRYQQGIAQLRSRFETVAEHDSSGNMP